MDIFLILLVFTLTFVKGEWIPEMENTGLYQGDIVLDPDEQEFKSKNGYASIKGGRWPDAIIPYEIWPSVDKRIKALIPLAIQEYEKHTCLRFKKRTTEREYIDIRDGRGCSSPVGFRKGRYNAVSLASGCRLLGTVMHEIGHSIGLYHEMNRPDRDNHIEIIWENVKKGSERNFKKLDSSIIDSLGTEYDPLSMMHYGKTAFGRYRKQTIKTKDPFYQDKIGQQKGFSEIDIKQINLMYCTGKTTPTLSPTLSPSILTSKIVTNSKGTTISLSTAGISCKDRSPKKTCEYWKKLGYCEKSISLKNTCCATCTT